MCLWGLLAFWGKARLSGAVRVPFGAMLAFFGGRVWLLDCVVDCGVHN